MSKDFPDIWIPKRDIIKPRRKGVGWKGKYGYILPGLLGVISGSRRRTVAGDPAYLTGQTVGTARNNFSGQVGFNVNVIGSDIVVTQLGRWVISGNSGTHTVGIYTTSAGIGAPLGSVSINTSGATPGDYAWATLASPVTLVGGGIQYYFFFTTETFGGDQWYNDDTTVTPLSVPTMVQSSYYNSGFNVGTVGNRAFGPTNFKFH